MGGTAPDYDNVRMGGPDGLRIPTEASKATFVLKKLISHSYASGSADWNMTPDEAQGSYYSVTSAGGGANAIFPAAYPGKIFVVNNTSGQTITFKVSGGSGVGVTTSKSAVLVCTASDIARVTADT